MFPAGLDRINPKYPSGPSTLDYSDGAKTCLFPPMTTLSILTLRFRQAAPLGFPSSATILFIAGAHLNMPTSGQMWQQREVLGSVRLSTIFCRWTWSFWASIRPPRLLSPEGAYRVHFLLRYLCLDSVVVGVDVDVRGKRRMGKEYRRH